MNKERTERERVRKHAAKSKGVNNEWAKGWGGGLERKSLSAHIGDGNTKGKRKIKRGKKTS